MAGRLSRDLTHLDCVILDVDDTVIGTDVAVAAGVAAVGDACGMGRERGAKIQEGFERAYALIKSWVMGWRGADEPELASLLACARRYQAPVLDAGFELKYWSRETMLAWALERAGAEVDGPLIESVMRVYWRTVAGATRIAPGALETLAALRDAQVPLVLATNSDGVLRWDAAATAFAYEPTHARAVKIERLRAALVQLAVPEGEVLVGDPVGKPTAEFARRVMDAVVALHGPRDFGRALAIGDSFPGDVEPFLRLGVGGGVWLRTRGVGVCDDPRVETFPHLAAWLGPM
jgi:FMN phosphatase YigB (HAD superfamily)